MSSMILVCLLLSLHVKVGLLMLAVDETAVAFRACLLPYGDYAQLSWRLDLINVLRLELSGSARDKPNLQVSESFSVLIQNSY